jgi:hypothetical protein
MQKIKYYINLTTGLEILNDLPVHLNELNFIRIQSSHCERGAFEDLLNSLDADFLIHLAMGYTCIVVDYGARSNTSKATRIGLEWIRYYLNKIWLDCDYKAIINLNDATEFFYNASNKISKKTRNKIKYYRKFLMTDQIKLVGYSKATYNDGTDKFFVDLVKKHIENNEVSETKNSAQ